MRQKCRAPLGGLGQFALEPGAAGCLLLDDAQDGIAAGGEFGQRRRRLVGSFLRAREGFGRRLQRGCRFGAEIGVAALGGGEGLGFAGQRLKDAAGVVQQVLLARQVGGDLRHALVEFAAPLFGAALFLVERIALVRDALQHRCTDGFLLAQARQPLAQFVAVAQLLGGRAGVFGQQPRGLVEACGIARRSLGGIFPRHIKSGRLELADLGGDLLVLGGLAGLALQAVELGLELRCDVLETGEVLFRRAELELGLVAARVQAGDAGGLFENEAAGLRLGIDDLGDLALAHQRRRARAGRDIGEEQLHVAGAHVLAVDAVGRARLAFDAARDLQRVVLIVLGRRAAVVVLHGDHDFRHVAGRALGGAGEDDVVHARGAHRLVGALAHDPAQGFQKIGLAAAIGADHAGEARLDQQIGRFHEGFESR